MLRLVENVISPSIVQSSNFMLDNVWTLQPVAVFEAGVSHASQSRSGTSRPLAIVKLYIDRKSQYYLVNIALPMALICALSFSSYGIDPNDLPARLSVTLTLVLTAVAYKFVLAQSIPAVSYLTTLDKYVLCQLGFLCVAALENVVSAHAGESHNGIYVFQGLIAGAWVLFHVFCYQYYKNWLKKCTMVPVSKSAINDKVAPTS